MIHVLVFCGFGILFSVPHFLQCQAIVLRTYDIGEADRFCILLTRERGRLPATASGARRPGSRLGGFLLPFRHLTLDLKESRSGFYVSSTTPAEPAVPDLAAVAPFTAAEEGIEFLLSLVPHEEADPAIFDAALRFLLSCAEPSPASGVAFQARLLHLLGLLPAEREAATVMRLREEETAFLRAVREGGEHALPPVSVPRLREFCVRCAGDHLTSALKAPSVIAELQ